MFNTVENSAAKLLNVMALLPRDEMGRSEADGATLQEFSGLSPAEINDGAALLVQSGYAEWRRYLGTAPFTFGVLSITPLGRHEHERTSSIIEKPLDLTRPRPEPYVHSMLVPPAPMGSPYGFTDIDWEYISDRKNRGDELNVVLGFQFQSDHYDATALQKNVNDAFAKAVDEYNRQPGAIPVSLRFQSLAAGYGEHLFNEIARDIIAADIAVFETSDLNPNVMLELGVALTWGVRVLPIKVQGQAAPPSDISGQTWADYLQSASSFCDADHMVKLVRMVERAARKKGGRLSGG